MPQTKAAVTCHTPTSAIVEKHVNGNEAAQYVDNLNPAIGEGWRVDLNLHWIKKMWFCKGWFTTIY